jgi:hypothetical protein
MTTNSNHKPTHRLYTVKGDDDAARWIEIGAAWPNKDSKGFTLQFDALPFDGRVVMREITERDNGGQS